MLALAIVSLLAVLPASLPSAGGAGLALAAAGIAPEPARAASGLARADPGPPSGARASSCLAERCTPVLSVAVDDPTVSRTRLDWPLAGLLDPSRFEPVSSLVSTVVAAGFLVEYEPRIFAGGRWGFLLVRLTIQLDPWNAPVFRWQR